MAWRSHREQESRWPPSATVAADSSASRQCPPRQRLGSSRLYGNVSDGIGALLGVFIFRIRPDMSASVEEFEALIGAQKPGDIGVFQDRSCLG
jgi:hypothetical protein